MSYPYAWTSSMLKPSCYARDFEDGDVIIDAAPGRRDNPAYLGIVTKSHTYGDLVCFLATKDLREGNCRWYSHPEGHTSGKCVKVSDEQAQAVWAEYAAAELLGEVKHYD